ncbi:MAG: glycosyltransferase family 4 protein [Rhodothermales bacterium]
MGQGTRIDTAPVFNVLVVAYYFPPMAMSGVQRPLKFVKYLPQHGWQPTVLTVEPGAYFEFDDSLEDELDGLDIDVHRVSSLDPARLFGRRKRISFPTEGRRKFASTVSQALFIPDNKIGWRRAAVRKGREILNSGDYHAIFSTAPPYTSHLVGLTLAAYSDLPLIADFRDDWVGNPRHVYPTPWHRGQHVKLESRLIENSAAVTVVNRRIYDQIIVRNLGPAGYHKVSMIPHGYDPQDFPRAASRRNDGKLRITYTGVFYDVQSPEPFLRAMALLLDRRPALKSQWVAEFVGHLSEKALDLIKRLHLEDAVDYRGYLPHRESVARLMDADILWMTVGKRPGNESISTGKLGEYIGARKPILGLVPEGAAREVLERYEASEIAPPDDPEAIAAVLESLYERWRTNSLPRHDEEYAVTFDQSRLAGRLAKVMHSTLPADVIT